MDSGEIENMRRRGGSRTDRAKLDVSIRNRGSARPDHPWFGIPADYIRRSIVVIATPAVASESGARAYAAPPAPAINKY
jgi:hypothetical protein